MDVIGGIRYQQPLGGLGARAAVNEATAGVRQAELRVLERERDITANTLIVAGELASAAERAANVRRSVALFEAARDNEREKLSLGVGSLVDLITVEDRLTAILASSVDADLEYATALANLWRTTGYVLETDPSTVSIAPHAFVTVPMPTRPRVALP